MPASTELSQTLQVLSEKLKSGTELLSRLKAMPDRVQENCKEFEKGILADCDTLIATIQRRKEDLVKHVREERDYKARTIKEQENCKEFEKGILADCDTLIATIQRRKEDLVKHVREERDYKARTIKEQIGTGLINRVANVDMFWHKEVPSTPRVSAEFDLTLDMKTLVTMISQLDFLQMK
ncbi:PREDICTED: E3 ubiquitin-protein ligase TRIM9-like, partial [Priapulus caudatus]|uniref:E3 ubiquitin-protein ligase TRIM9-like n=1 Tax=Priapulus caudatus TaxID=37621 RepID=A0ABM1EWX2_PRICU